MPIIQCNQQKQPTGKSGSNSSTFPISLNPSLSTPTFITTHVSQSYLQEEADKAGDHNSEWHCYACAFQEPFRTHQFKICLLPHGWYPQPALGAAPAPGHHQDLAATLRESPHTTCAQQPANPICLLDKQLHILSRKDFRTTAKTHSLHCFCHVLSPQGHMGWLEMRTYHRANTNTWDFLKDMQPVQDTQVKQAKKPPREPELLFHVRAGATSSHCIDPTPSSTAACTGCLECCTNAFWGESLIFQGKLDTQGLTLITGSGH